jgi:hypothetical protein
MQLNSCDAQLRTWPVFPPVSPSSIGPIRVMGSHPIGIHDTVNPQRESTRRWRKVEEWRQKRVITRLCRRRYIEILNDFPDAKMSDSYSSVSLTALSKIHGDISLYGDKISVARARPQTRVSKYLIEHRYINRSYPTSPYGSLDNPYRSFLHFCFPPNKSPIKYQLTPTSKFRVTVHAHHY